MKQILIYVLVIIAIFIAVSIGLGYFLSAPAFKGEAGPHFNGNKFVNLSGKEASGFSDLLKWFISRDQEPWKEITKKMEAQIPMKSVDTALHISFINHATFLIQTAEVNIITDPIFSERASPFDWTGPKRMRPVGIRMEDVPTVDVVVISHNHYDHLDKKSVQSLQMRDDPLFVVPLGVGKYLSGLGIANYTELNWWESYTWHDFNIQAVPAQHFSGRGMFDRDKTLWAGYMIRSPKHHVYFAGDTGYDESMFLEISERAGSPDIALLPIGAYKPRWFMSPIHVSPAEAVRIHQDVKAKQSIAMHYGTFPLADEGQFTPVNELDSVKKDLGMGNDEFIILQEGQRIIRH